MNIYETVKKFFCEDKDSIQNRILFWMIGKAIECPCCTAIRMFLFGVISMISVDMLILLAYLIR